VNRWTPDERRAYYRARYAKKRAALVASLGGKCVDCGGTERLELDHVDPRQKSFDLGPRWANRADHPAVVAEMRKVVLRCHGCHRQKTKREDGVAFSKVRKDRRRAS
jgi:5-methylcytosine-specific restriction endonuclease McrA